MRTYVSGEAASRGDRLGRNSFDVRCHPALHTRGYGRAGRLHRSPPDATPRAFFANHANHGDFVLIWAVLPSRARARVRPVAAAEYWMASALRRHIGQRVFNAVLIDRDPAARRQGPVAQMVKALDGGASLIVFPEGTRNVTDRALLPFRSGLYHLACARLGIELVPVWITNLSRVMPKGGLVPVPLICTVTFGGPMRVGAEEAKDAFLERAAAALLALAPVSRTEGLAA